MNSLEIRKRFLGYGNADTALLAFVGWEFGGDPSSPLADQRYMSLVKSQSESYEKLMGQDVREYLCLKRNNWNLDLGVTPSELEAALHKRTLGITEAIQVYFSIAFRQKMLNDRDWSIDRWREFYVKEFCASKEVQVNLYPIQARRRTDEYSRRLVEAYGLENSERGAVSDAFWSDGLRLNLLKHLINGILARDKRSMVVFMGCEDKRKEIIASIFPTTHFEPFPSKVFLDKKYKRTRNLFYSDDRRVWFTQHPSGGWLTRTMIDWILDSSM